MLCIEMNRLSCRNDGSPQWYPEWKASGLSVSWIAA